MIAYTGRPATTTNMAGTMARTGKDSSRMANAGVDTGAKMLGVGATTAIARRKLSLLRACCEGRGGRVRSESSVFQQEHEISRQALHRGGERVVRVLPALQPPAVRRPVGWRSEQQHGILGRVTTPCSQTAADPP